jgi:peroxiredoxin
MTESLAPRLDVGATAPTFDAGTLDGGRISLEDLLGDHHLVLHFMREFT